MQFNVSILICRFPPCVVLWVCFFLEMVGLGNSCRGMKSPPLLVAVLVACIIVLGFNYWIASSRSADLQVTFLLLCILSCTCVFNKQSTTRRMLPLHVVGQDLQLVGTFTNITVVAYQ